MTGHQDKQTSAVLHHHLRAVGIGGDGRGNLDAIMEDYTEASVLYTPRGPVRGLVALREFFESFIQRIAPEMWQAFELAREDVDGEIAYIVWSAKPFVVLGTDTFIVRDGKILVQTFATQKT